MLQDRERRLKAARDIVRDAMRTDSDEHGLNPLDSMFHRHGGMHLFIPITDEIACRRVLLFLHEQTGGLVAEMDRCATPRSKRLLAHSTLAKWSQSFKRLVKTKGEPLHALD